MKVNITYNTMSTGVVYLMSNRASEPSFKCRFCMFSWRTASFHTSSTPGSSGIQALFKGAHTLGKSCVIFLMFWPLRPIINLWSHLGASTLADTTLLAFSYTWVRATPNLSGSPRKVMVSRSLSAGGISTETPGKVKTGRVPHGYVHGSTDTFLIHLMTKIIGVILQQIMWKLDGCHKNLKPWCWVYGKDQNKTLQQSS